MKTTFKFPKTVMSVAGAAAMVVTTGFISSEAIEVVEEAEEVVVEMEEEVFLGTQYRWTWGCGTRAGTCLPTFCCVE